MSTALAAVLAGATAVQAESVTLRWRHAAPGRVAGFRVYFGATSGRLAQSIDVGRLTPDAGGIFRTSVELPDGEPVYVAISAYDASGVESPRSAEWLHATSLAAPGQPRVVDP